jgi:quinol monooxygenase YgiN
MADGECMVIAGVSIRVLAQKSEELRRALSSLVGPTSVQAGCLGCEVYCGISDESMHLDSRWKTQNDLLRHLRSETYRRLLFIMELSVEKPRIEFLTVTGVEGWELIERARIESAEQVGMGGGA